MLAVVYSSRICGIWPPRMAKGLNRSRQTRLNEERVRCLEKFYSKECLTSGRVVPLAGSVLPSLGTCKHPGGC